MPVHFPNRVAGTLAKLWARRRRNRRWIHGKGKKFFLLKSVHIISEVHTVTYSVGTGNGQIVKVNTDFHSVWKLRITAAKPLLPPYAFIAFFSSFHTVVLMITIS